MSISTPTRLSTSLAPSPSSYSTSSSSSNSPSPVVPPDPPATSNNGFTTNSPATNTFNYYFLIVAVVAVLFCVIVLYIGRRKRRKAALLRSHGQYALARDVEGWRGRLGVGRGTVNDIHDVEMEEGLNERGEAPPPYVPGSKPPSIRTNDGRRQSTNSRHNGTEGVELGNINDRNGSHPPGYREHANLSFEEDVADIRRPDAVVTAPANFGSMR